MGLRLALGFWAETREDARAQMVAWVKAEPAVTGYRLRRLWQPEANRPRWTADVDLTFQERPDQLELAL